MYKPSYFQRIHSEILVCCYYSLFNIGLLLLFTLSACSSRLILKEFTLKYWSAVIIHSFSMYKPSYSQRIHSEILVCCYYSLFQHVQAILFSKNSH
jgi:uncharacterized protein (UPF0332 family)